MLIAVPAETDPGKGRVAATPETVKKFIGLGAKVVVQSGAGLASGILDADSVTGSVIALDGRMSGKPIMLPQRHAINIGLAVACSSCSCVIRGEGHFSFWLIVLVSSPSAFC